MQSHYIGIKPTLTKNLPLCVFELLTYQNAKPHAKHFFYGEAEKHYKKRVLTVFDHLRIKTLKYMQRNLSFGNERTLRETSIMTVFKFLKYQNVKTHK